MRPFRWLLWLALRTTRPVPSDSRAELARRARLGRRWLLIIAACWFAIVSAGLLAGTILAHVALWEVAPSNDEEVVEDLVTDEWHPYAVAWAAAIVLPTLAALVAVLVKRRLRVRRLLLKRDQCWSCGHGLNGLRIENNKVTCPECAAATVPFEAWGEVTPAASEGAAATFTPAEGLARVFWTRARLVKSGKVCAAVACIAALLYGGWWVWREVGIRRQASIARSERIDPARITALIRGGAPEPTHGQLTALEVIDHAQQKYKLLYDQFYQAHKGSVKDPAGFAPDLFFVARPSEHDLDAESSRYSLLLFEHLLQAGLFDDVDRLQSVVLTSQEVFTPVDQAPSDGPPMPPGVTMISRLCAARARVAVDNDKPDDFRAAIRTHERLKQTIANGMLINLMIATSFESRTLQSLDYAAHRHPFTPWMDAVTEELTRLQPLPVEKCFDAERLSVLDSLAWYFSEPGRVRKGLHAPELEEKYGIGGEFSDVVRGLIGGETDVPARLGSYVNNRDDADALFAALKQQAMLEPWQQTAEQRTLPRSDLVIVNHSIGILGKLAKSGSPLLLRRRALITKIALERYSLEHGSYPSSLDALVPEVLSELPLDPYSGRPLCYRVGGPNGYELWSVGFDGIDNGGTVIESFTNRALFEDGTGSDELVTRPDW